MARFHSCRIRQHRNCDWRPKPELDPNLHLPYTVEYMGGLDQELMRDMTARFTFVRKFERERYSLLNTAIPMSAYNTPVQFRDVGRDGLANTADDQTLTLLSRDPSFNGLRADLLTNDPANTSASQRSISKS